MLGLITARGGSKGVPRKNLAPCGGLPLLSWTCRAARSATVLTRTIISTDDPEIAELAAAECIESPFMRPRELASDTAASIEVARHTVEWLAEHEAWQTEILVLLQPTSPMRTAKHIDEAYALLGPEDDSVVSVIDVPHSFKPWSVMQIRDGYATPFVTGELPFDRTRRQGQPTLVARNGPAVIVSRRSTLDAGTFYGGRCVPYAMARFDSIDIDDGEDLELADWLLRRRGVV
ncbi:MAG TPA: acylneuraminate cytidylyltransferase family protein [Kofleriaceae bacterium]